MILVWLPWLMVVLGLLFIIYYSVISIFVNFKLILMGIGLVVVGLVFKFNIDNYKNSLSVVNDTVVNDSLGYEFDKTKKQPAVIKNKSFFIKSSTIVYIIPLWLVLGIYYFRRNKGLR